MAQVENKDSAHYFFEDLALQNEAQSHAMETVYTLSKHSLYLFPSLGGSDV